MLLVLLLVLVGLLQRMLVGSAMSRVLLVDLWRVVVVVAVWLGGGCLVWWGLRVVVDWCWSWAPLSELQFVVVGVGGIVLTFGVCRVVAVGTDAGWRRCRMKVWLCPS